MVDIKEFYYDEVKEDEYYYRFYDFITSVNKSYNECEGEHNAYNYAFEVYDAEEAIQKYRELCQPDVDFDNEKKCWFYLLSFFLYKCEYIIKEFPRVLARPPIEPTNFTYSEIRNRIISNGDDDDGIVRYSTRRAFVSNLSFIHQEECHELKNVSSSCRLENMSDNVKYQVFVSSTYRDLVNERRKILEVLLRVGCIPAGMENFVAEDDDQFNVIKRVIDLCDYYILIIGKRYGSINEKTGLSYTEMEYDYAIEKGIPVLVFALDDDAQYDKSGENDTARKKLANFKNKAMKNRLASLWKNQADLSENVVISVMKAISEIKRPGWHRGVGVEKE